jgi:hypothetical protein
MVKYPERWSFFFRKDGPVLFLVPQNARGNYARTTRKTKEAVSIV